MRLKPISKSPYKELIGEYFNYTWNFDFLDIVAEVLERIDDFSNEEEIYQSVDDELIYTSDQWIVLKFYSPSPQEAYWDIAYNNFVRDISTLASKIASMHKFNKGGN